MELQVWKKFMRISTAATLTSFLNRPINEVVEEYQDLYIALGTELRSLAEAKGVKLPDDIIYSTIEGQKKMPKNTSTSMHADFLKGHPTEVETLTGYVVREAEKEGLQVPTYKFMYNGLTTLPYPVEKE
ncbi:MAG: hypothetical protein LUD02_11930 [Tannerellaceae bacterium]|nr:hypothetical protein [Tannerellaceae bacterium]